MDISNQVDAFNPAANAAKNGLTGRAAGMATFYGGSTDPANTQKLQKFSNLYSTIAGRQHTQPKMQNPMEPGGVVKRTTQQDVDMASRDKINSNGQSSRGDRVQNVAPLDHMLRTGAIDLDTYYKAQGDEALYARLMKGYK